MLVETRRVDLFWREVSFVLTAMDTSQSAKMSANPDFQSPKRHQYLPGSFNMTPTHTPLRDAMMLAWGGGVREGDLSPADSCSSQSPLSPDPEGLRRGRPRAESIGSLIIEGSKTPGSIKCKVCNRNFPREKSLQAHMRTHTGERPYVCDYPECGRAFCQSGQLRTHQRLHTGEKPFKCSVDGCDSRFAHANRHCAYHPAARLVRDPSPVVSPNSQGQNPEVLFWLKRYSQQQDRTPRRTVRPTKRSLTQDIENQGPPTPLRHNTAQQSQKVCKRLNPGGTDPLQPHNNQDHDEDMGVKRLEPDLPIISPRKQEQSDRLIGAIALVELAHGFGL